MRRFLIIFVVFITLITSGGIARAVERMPAYMAEVDVILHAGDVLYTLYPGLSVKNMMENFKGATQWTIIDGGESKNIDPNVHQRNYYIYRNIGESEPVYEVIHISTNENNEFVWAYDVSFFTNSEKIARLMFNKATNENTIKYGPPDKSNGKQQAIFGGEKGEIHYYDSLGLNVWRKHNISISGLDHYEGKAAEIISNTFHLPEVMHYSIRMIK